MRKPLGETSYTELPNCFKNLASFSLNSRISLTSYSNSAGLSTPIPNAKPVYLLLSMPQFSSTVGCTIPQPKISTQPVCLQMRQPLPSQIKQLISISALGSVKGKYDGRKRTLTSLPNISCTKKYRVCFRSAKLTLSSMYKPSTW